MNSINLIKYSAVVLGFMMSILSCVSKHQKKSLQVERAKTNFALSNFDKGTEPFDSVYTKDDTIRFYKKGVYKGMTVISTE
jgi:hypothetical protein